MMAVFFVDIVFVCLLVHECMYGGHAPTSPIYDPAFLCSSVKVKDSF